MSDQMLLMFGVFVFSLLSIGAVLTIVEFRRMSRRDQPRSKAAGAAFTRVGYAQH